MLKARFSILTLLATVFTLSVTLALVLNRVRAQQNAVAIISNCEGSAFCNTVKLDQSFVNNFRYSVTKIEIPRIQLVKKLSDSIDNLPRLNRIEITSDYDPHEIERTRVQFPNIEIEHSFEPLIALIQ